MTEVFVRSLVALRAAIAAFVIFLFLYMTVAVFAQVLGRYVFNYSIAVADETASFALIWMVLFGAGVAMRRNQHVGIDILVAICPPIVRRTVTLLSTILGLWFLWVLFAGGLTLIEVGRFQLSAVMHWPMSFAYVALPAGAAYFALEFTIAMVPRILGRETADTSDADLSGEL